MEITTHGSKRQQQRGIPDYFVEMILEFGTEIHKPGNALEYRLTQKDKFKAVRFLKSQIQALDKAIHKAVLVNDGHIITVYNLRG
jgi:hypothetical protein